MDAGGQFPFLSLIEGPAFVLGLGASNRLEQHMRPESQERQSFHMQVNEEQSALFVVFGNCFDKHRCLSVPHSLSLPSVAKRAIASCVTESRKTLTKVSAPVTTLFSHNISTVMNIGRGV